MTKEEKTKKLEELYEKAIEVEDYQTALCISDRIAATTERLEELYNKVVKVQDFQTALCILDRIDPSTDSS